MDTRRNPIVEENSYAEGPYASATCSVRGCAGHSAMKAYLRAVALVNP